MFSEKEVSDGKRNSTDIKLLKVVSEVYFQSFNLLGLWTQCELQLHALNLS